MPWLNLRRIITRWQKSLTVLYCFHDIFVKKTYVCWAKSHLFLWKLAIIFSIVSHVIEIRHTLQFLVKVNGGHSKWFSVLLWQILMYQDHSFFFKYPSKLPYTRQLFSMLKKEKEIHGYAYFRNWQRGHGKSHFALCSLVAYTLHNVFWMKWYISVNLIQDKSILFQNINRIKIRYQVQSCLPKYPWNDWRQDFFSTNIQNQIDVSKGICFLGL